MELDEESWDLVHRVNVKGTFLCSRAVARHMIARGRGGKIVNISSTTGKQGAALYAAYSASKFAVVGFTQFPLPWSSPATGSTSTPSARAWWIRNASAR